MNEDICLKELLEHNNQTLYKNAITTYLDEISAILIALSFGRAQTNFGRRCRPVGHF